MKGKEPSGGVIPPTRGKTLGGSGGKTSLGQYPGGKSNIGGFGMGHESNAKPNKPYKQTKAEPAYPCNQEEFHKLGNSKGIRGK